MNRFLDWWEDGLIPILLKCAVGVTAILLAQAVVLYLVLVIQ